MDLEGEIEKIRELRESKKTKEDIADEAFKNLQERIIAGETTGDKIDDFFIVCYNALPQELQTEKIKAEKRGLSEEIKSMLKLKPKLVALEREISENQGQRFLVWTHEITVGRHEGDENSSKIYELTRFTFGNSLLTLGTLNGNCTFDLTKKGILIPTEHFVSKNWLDYRKEQWEKQEGPIYLSSYALIHLDEEQRYIWCSSKRGIPEFPSIDPDVFQHIRGEPPNNKPNQCLKVLVGNENIEKLFKYGLSRIYTQDLIDKIKQGEEFTGKERIDTSYVEALQLLDIDAPQDFQIKYGLKQLKSKEEVITNIESYLAQSERLDEKFKSKIRIELENAQKLGMFEQDETYELGPQGQGKHIHSKQYLTAVQKLIEEFS